MGSCPSRCCGRHSHSSLPLLCTLLLRTTLLLLLLLYDRLWGAYLLIVWGLRAALEQARARHGGPFLEHGGAHAAAQAAVRLPACAASAAVSPLFLSESARSPTTTPPLVVVVELLRDAFINELAMAGGGHVPLLLLLLLLLLKVVVVCRHDV